MALAQFGTPLEPLRQLDDLLTRRHEVVHAGHGHEGQPDGKQHLIQVRLLVHGPVKRSLQHRSQQRNAEKGDRQTHQKGHVKALHQQHSDVTAAHGKGTMRQVDEVHQPQRDRQPHTDEKQQHARGNAIKKNRQHENEIGSLPLFTWKSVGV